MVYYHQNMIKKTLGLTISPFFMMTNLAYLGEKKIFPSNQSWIYNQYLRILKPRQSRHIRENLQQENNVSHQIYRHIIYHKSNVSINTSYVQYVRSKKMICMYESSISSLLDLKISPPLAT